MEDSLTQYDNMLKQVGILSKKAQEDIKIYYTNAIILKLKELNRKDQDIYISQIKKRKMTQNIKIRNLKQFLKRTILTINIKLYLKILSNNK